MNTAFNFTLVCTVPDVIASDDLLFLSAGASIVREFNKAVNRSISDLDSSLC